MKSVQNGRVVVVLELCHNPATCAWTTVLSVPGRSGTLSRTWGGPGRQLTPSELLDLAGSVQKSVTDAVEMYGVQGTLGI